MIEIGPVLLALAVAAPASPADERARYAADIAAVADDLDQGLALVTIARFESDLRASVERCQITGDGGDAVGLYQLHAHWLGGHTRDEVCRSNRLSSRLAAHAVGHLRRVTGSYEIAFVRYIGTTKPTDPRARARVDLFHRLQKEIAAHVA